ncbi:MAG: acyl carrier protein, partial [Hyphomicrobiales bacterium]|nr:acyl carrier protein [Hyphomicrobiales bacterium]
MDINELLAEIRSLAGAVLQVDAARLDADEPLGYLGFDSAALKLFAARLSERFGAPIDAVTLFTYPTLRSLGEFLADQGLGAERPTPVV